MTAPGFSGDAAALVKAMGNIATVFDILQDHLLNIHNAHTHPDAVRMLVADALGQVDEGRRILALKGGEA